MEFLKVSKRRTVFAELVYIVLNLALAIALLVIVRTVDSPLPAIALVVLSKWRVFAVRPRYWFANLQANLVDLIVSVSVVILLYTAGGALATQIGITVLYAAWLLLVKPRSKRAWISVQAGVATFFGIAALAMISHSWDAALVVLISWLIGYAGARHILNGYDHTHTMFFCLVWAFIVAEISWLTYHWNFAYAVPGLGAIMLPQGAIITLGLGFVAARAYISYHKHGTIRSGDVLLPALLAASIILIMLTVFNQFTLAAS